MELTHRDEYINWLQEVKAKIASAQLKALHTVNKALIHFYFDLGKVITEKQENAQWGDKLLDQLSHDLSAEFPDMKGFSKTNLKYCKRFYSFYSQNLSQLLVDPKAESVISQQPVDQLPWGHNILIFTKSATIDEARFYIHETLENNWSRDVLALHIKSNLYERQGKAVTNFKTTLPEPQSDLAQQTIKDPYIFDFVSLTKPAKISSMLYLRL